MHISFASQEIEEIDLDKFGGEEDRKTLSLVKSLDLSRNEIHRLSNLQTFTSLNILNLSRNKLKKLSGLPLGLTKLDVSHNLLTKIVGIEILSSLQELNISFNHINHTYNSFLTLVNLTHLNLSNNHIKLLDGLEHLVKLIDLNVMNNEISNIDSIRSLSNLRNLQYLKIRGNPIAKQANHVNSISTLVPSLTQIDAVDLNSGLLDDQESISTMNSVITSEEDLEYETESSIRKLNVLNSKRRFSFQSTSEGGDNFSTASSVLSFKRPSTPQPSRLTNAPKEISSRPSSSRGMRPSSAPKKTLRPTLSNSAQQQSSTRTPTNVPSLKMLNTQQPLPTFEDEQSISLKRDARAVDDLKLILSEEQNENIRLEKANESLRNEIISLKTQIKNLNLDFETYRTANENLLAEAEENKKKFDRIQRNYRNIQQLYKEEKQKRISIEENRAELQKQVSKMRVALHQHKSKLEMDHREKTQTFDMVKEQHDHTKHDINILLEYISVMEHYNIQQQKQFEELSAILEVNGQEEVREITQSILSARSSIGEQNLELTEKVRTILETYHPERANKKSRMKGNPNVRNFNEFRHLAHSKANCSTYHWETSLRHIGDVKKQNNGSNQNNNIGSGYVTSPNASSIVLSNSESKRPPTPQQNNHQHHQQQPQQKHQQHLAQKSVLTQQVASLSQPPLNTVTIPSVIPEKQSSLIGENPQSTTTSSNIFKIIEEQSQNLITLLKSNESFNNNSFEDKVDHLTSFEDTHHYSTNFTNYNDNIGLDLRSSSENLFPFTPTKDEEILVVTDEQPTTNESPSPSNNVEDAHNTSTNSSTRDSFFSKLSPEEIHHLLSQLVKQQQLMSTTASISSSSLEHSTTTTNTSSSTTPNNSKTSGTSSLTTNDDHSKIREVSSSIEPSGDEEDIQLTRDIHFPSPEQNLLNTSPYKNEREMIVKQRLHERLAFERKKMGVGGLDM